VYARVSTIQGAADRIDEGASAIRDEILPSVKQIGGFQGIISLADRTTGRGLTLTLWDTEDDLRASEEQANQLRSQAAEKVGATQAPQVDRYEVVLFEVEAGVRVS
jgi:heme-degrading monooxygenase HmoA